MRIPATGAVFRSAGGHFCRRLLGPSVLGRTRGRAGVPMRRRRRDGGPAPPFRRAPGSGRFGPRPKQRESAPHGRFRDGRSFLWWGMIFASAPCVAAVPAKGGRGRPAPGRQSRPREKGEQSAPGTTQRPARGWTRRGGRVGPPSRRRRRSGTPAAPRRGVRFGGVRPDPAACGGARSSSAGATRRGEPQARRGRGVSRSRDRSQRQAMRLPPRALGAASTRAGRSGERERAHCPPGDGRAVFRSVGVSFAIASLARAVRGGPEAGSRDHCSAVAAAEVRSRPAAGSGAASARAGRSGERERAPLPMPATGAFLSLGGGRFATACLPPAPRGGPEGGSRYHCSVAGATAVRRSPVPPGGRLGAASAGRRSGDRERATVLPATGGCLSLGGRSFLPPLAWP